MKRTQQDKLDREKEKQKKKFYELCESVFDQQRQKFEKLEAAVSEMVANI
jgi:hypothetical protein